MRRTTLRLALVRVSKRKRVHGKRWRRVYRLNLAKPAMWRRARAYLDGTYHHRAALERKPLWSGPIYRLLRR